jgi:hypothetical protein
MAEQREQVEAELENIERVLAELPDYKSLPKLSTLELAGLLPSFIISTTA